MEESKGAFKILSGKSTERNLSKDLRRRWEDNSTVGFKEIRVGINKRN
jgi:hypothetical protein